MGRIYNSVDELIGRTPLMRLERFENELNLKAQILAKLECFNPAGSVKDRVAARMITDAEKSGILHTGAVIIEPTSGNTGIGLASVAASRGYRAIIVMPDTMSIERQKLIGAYGAEIVLSDGALGMTGAIAEAERIAKETPNSIIAGQFVNPSNPAAHYDTTGPEIWCDTDGEVDVFVAGVGTGGTISGVGGYLKEKNPGVQIIGAEPQDSPYLTEGRAGAHGIQGIGAGFKPKTLDTDVIDEIITVETADAYEMARLMARREGVLVGISSGAALAVAAKIAARDENTGKKIVVLLPDTGERYLSTTLFN